MNHNLELQTQETLFSSPDPLAVAAEITQETTHGNTSFLMPAAFMRMSFSLSILYLPSAGHVQTISAYPT